MHRPLWERACSRTRTFIQHVCRLTHRFREQARSHIESYFTCSKFVVARPRAPITPVSTIAISR
ncbi:hypothetical protein PspS34_02805 [Pseudomonas sp. S34]|nr:hypothetical protein PspS34_02805 [Pseudomonas sp. S34]